MANTKFDGFPFEYGKVTLLDELLIRGYRQQIERFQRIALSQEQFTDAEIEKNSGIIPDAAVLAIEASTKRQKAWEESQIKRDALFTKESINRHFSLQAQLKHYGFWGKFIAWLLGW